MAAGQPVAGSHRHQQRQGGIQSAGQADYRPAAGMASLRGQSCRLNIEEFPRTAAPASVDLSAQTAADLSAPGELERLLSCSKYTVSSSSPPVKVFIRRRSALAARHRIQ